MSRRGKGYAEEDVAITGLGPKNPREYVDN